MLFRSVTADYLHGIEHRRGSQPVTVEDTDGDPVANQLDLNLASGSSD